MALSYSVGKMRKIVGILLFLGGFLYLTNLMAQADDSVEPDPFDSGLDDMIGRPVRLAVISPTDHLLRETFYSEIFVQDGGRVLDILVRPQTSSEMDAIVFLLDSWGSASELPGRDIVGHVYDEVSLLDDRVSEHAVWVELNHSRFIMLVFLNESTSPTFPIRCAASRALAILDLGTVEVERDPEFCG